MGNNLGGTTTMLVTEDVDTEQTRGPEWEKWIRVGYLDGPVMSKGLMWRMRGLPQTTRFRQFVTFRTFRPVLKNLVAGVGWQKNVWTLRTEHLEAIWWTALELP